MNITELIEKLKAMPEKMEGYSSEEELVVFNTIGAANALERSLRNCDVGTVEEQAERFHAFCASNKKCGDVYSCERCQFNSVEDCELAWSQMPYEEGGANGK